MKKICNHLLPYITNELSKVEQREFKEHLETCLKCNNEYNQIKESWEALQSDIEETEVPESLKSEVFEFVFAQQKDEQNLFTIKLKNWLTYLKQQFTPLTTVLILTLLTIIVLNFKNTKLSYQTAINKELSSRPVEILSTLTLSSVNQSEANGHAFIVHQGQEKKLIVQVNNLQKTEGKKVYQVWLLNKGVRKNAGIFKPNNNGSGILTFELQENEVFDKIGITLEPDENSVKPRGEKIVGT
ncbi:anti-sigma factor [Bacillus sp. AFS041924]|uniref:anti-sigma factor n=1 Tax=Bacillus sp. AFS041924 TaxID=2033503 RepID=UPI000BFB37F1|nr:anti-sigma factor [Bacillus sp. AFS041924]PGS51224.1 hypothetical protein COC46_11820 [Bacillus sp. AFS041924]